MTRTKFQSGDRVRIAASNETGTVDRMFFGHYIVNIDKEFVTSQYDSGVRWVPGYDMVAEEGTK